MRPQCLDSAETTLRNITLGGVARPVGFVVAEWSSAAFLGEVMMILCREVLGIEAVLSAKAATSAIAAERLAGCATSASASSTCADPSNGGGDVHDRVNDVAMEVWDTFAVPRIEALSPSVRPESLGAPGFQSHSGLFIPGTTFDSSDADVHLDFYRTYLSSSGNAHNVANQFRSYAYVVQNISGREDEVLEPCAQDPVMRYALSSSEAKPERERLAS